MKKIHKKVMALLLAALMITSVMDTHVQAESSTEANNISVVNDGTGDAAEVSDVEEKDMEENTDETEKKEESDVEEADTEAVKEEVEGSADDEEKNDVDTYEAKDTIAVQAAKKAPTEVKSCTVSGFMPEILNLEFSDKDWMNAITGVTVNNSEYRKGSLSWTSDTDLWEVGSATGAYGSYTALKMCNPSSYPATIRISATDYEDLSIKVKKDTSKYPYVYTATIESNGSGENPDTPSAASYAITVGASENGTVTSDKETAKAGEAVTLTVVAGASYELETLTVTGESNKVVNTTKTTDSTYTFTMPGEAVKVTATFKEYVPGQITVSDVTLSKDYSGNTWYFTFDINGYAEKITAFKVNNTAWTKNTSAPSLGGQYYPNTNENRIEVAAKSYSTAPGPGVLKSGDSIIISANGYSDLALKFTVDTNGKASLVADDGKGDPCELHVKIDGSFEAAIVGQKNYDGVSGASSGGTSSNKNSAVTVYGALVEKGSKVQDSDWQTLDHQSKINLNGPNCKVNIVPDTKKGTNENSDSGMKGVYLTSSSDLTLNGTPKDAGNYLISISVEDDQGRTAVSNALPFVIYTGEETLADQIKTENLRKYSNGLYAWDIMEPWAIKNFGSNVAGKENSVRVPKDLEVWFGSHQSGTYGYLGYDITWDQVKAGNIPQTLYIPDGCSLSLTNMEILSSVRIVVESGGKLTLSDSVVQGIIDVQGGGTFSMNYDAFNGVFTRGASVCGQVRLADGAILENAAIYSHTNYLANGDMTDRSNDDPVVQATGNVTVKGQVYIKGDEAGSTGKGQTALGVKNGTITLADDAVLATYGGGGKVQLYAEGGNALKLENGTVTGNGQLIAIGGDVLWGKGGTAVAGSGAITTKSALLQGATSRETKNAEPGKAADTSVWVNSPNRYVKDGTCIDGAANDPLADLYWTAGGVEATPKAETLTKYTELTNMSNNEKPEIDKNPGNGSSAGVSSSSGSHKHKHSSSDNSAATTSVQAAATSFAEAVSGTAAATNTKTTTTLANLQAIAAAENAKNAEAVSGVDEETEDAGSVTVSENAASDDTDSETEVVVEDNESDAQGQKKGSIPVVPIVGLLVVAGGLLIFFAGRKKQKIRQ